MPVPSAAKRPPARCLCLQRWPRSAQQCSRAPNARMFTNRNHANAAKRGRTRRVVPACPIAARALKSGPNRAPHGPNTATAWRPQRRRPRSVQRRARAIPADHTCRAKAGLSNTCNATPGFRKTCGANGWLPHGLVHSEPRRMADMPRRPWPRAPRRPWCAQPRPPLTQGI